MSQFYSTYPVFQAEGVRHHNRSFQRHQMDWVVSEFCLSLLTLYIIPSIKIRDIKLIETEIHCTRL